MKKYSILKNISVDRLVFGGNGLAIAPDGRRIMIAGGAIPKSIVDIRITRVKKNYLEAQILKTVQKSPFEQDIPDKWQLYGGCKWLPIPYEIQLDIKEKQIKEAFHNIKHLTKNTVFHPIISSTESEHYRNKIEFSWGKYISAREGIHDDYRFGFHVPGQFDRIEDCRYCVLADDEINAIFHDIDAIARKSNFPTYDPKTKVGFWRHLVIRKAKNTQEIMLIFSVNAQYEGEYIDFFSSLTDTLSAAYSNIVSIYFLENTGPADIVHGNFVHIFGKTTITEHLLGFDFDIQPRSFFQVNTLTAELLYSRVSQQIHYAGGVLLDLYAGTGTIGIILSKLFQKVYSVELVTSATEDGKKNALKNTISNIDFINAKVEDFAKDFAEKGEKADTIVLDPPRSGLHPSAIGPIIGFGAKEIIYVSCNPATLVRDVELLLVDKGYVITDITPVDMFPHTHHIEAIVRLEQI